MFDMSFLFPLSTLLFPLSSFLRKILRHPATKGHGEGLDATADAEDGDLTIIGETGGQQLGIVALLIDAMKKRRRFFACPEGVVVATTAEDETINPLEGVDDHMAVGNRRDDDRYATCLHHRLVVTTADLTRQVLVVSRDTNDRHWRCLWELGVDALQLRLQVELVIHTPSLLTPSLLTPLHLWESHVSDSVQGR